MMLQALANQAVKMMPVFNGYQPFSATDDQHPPAPTRQPVGEYPVFCNNLCLAGGLGLVSKAPSLGL